MNTQRTIWLHTVAAFGCGLIMLQPRLILVMAFVAGAGWVATLVLRLARYHWPGWRTILSLAGDGLVLLLLLGLLLGVLWLLPAA